MLILLKFQQLEGTVSDYVVKSMKQISALLIRNSHHLFVDEIHRFNRAQQDALLHAVKME